MAWWKWVEDKLFKASRVTQVANAYTENLHVKVTADRRYFEQDFDVCVADYGIKSGKNVWEKCTKNGFTKIPPKHFFEFEPNTAYRPREPTSEKKDMLVYITIVTESGEIIWDSKSKKVNASVIVDRSGNLLKTKMGTIWTDTSGKCHQTEYF